jgi:hypothetical protein
MSDRPENPGAPRPSGEPGSFTQEVHHSQVSARVPERVARGVFSTGAMVFQGAHEFVIDFVLRMGQPHQIAARVVLPPSMMPSLIAAIRDNIANYQSKFGPPPPLMNPPPPPTPPSIEEIYDRLKLQDDMLSGAYANGALIAHTQSEFSIDFITNFYPRSAVSCRVFLSAAQMPGFLNTLSTSFHQYQQKLASQQQQQPRPPEQRPPGT